MPKDECLKQYLSDVADLGCIICEATAELHHPRSEQGMSQRASDWLVIPLCPIHHRLGYELIPGIHSHPERFRRLYGTEEELFNKTQALMQKLQDNLVIKRQYTLPRWDHETD